MGLDENDLLLVDLVDNPGLPEGENCYFQQYDGEYISSNVSKCHTLVGLFSRDRGESDWSEWECRKNL